jgi:hypothetical protein
MNEYLNKISNMHVSDEATAMAAIAVELQNLNMSFGSLGSLSGIYTMATALSNINSLLQELRDEEKAQKLEDLRTNRDGTWVTEWYVAAPPRKAVLFDSEEAAYEGAREARKALGDEAEINVFCTEIKRFNSAVVPAQNWEEQNQDFKSPA